LFVVTVA